jgi:hypothetical protein
MPKYRYVSGEKEFDDVITLVSKYGKICKFGVKMDLTQSHLEPLLRFFLSSLSFSFNRAETSSFAHPLQILNLRELISVLYFVQGRWRNVTVVNNGNKSIGYL